ncbi:MAG: VOC family protein [Coleofasciculaceae cyanobacterium]
MTIKFIGPRLLVINYEACLQFYQDILGFEVTYKDVDGEEADLKLGEMSLNIIKWQSMANLTDHPDKPSTTISDKIMLTFETPDVEQTYQQLKAKGANFVTEPTFRPDWQVKTVYLRDPDSNLIGIYQVIR